MVRSVVADESVRLGGRLAGMNPGGGSFWEGARNLSDLGGLPRRDGSQTRTGCVWRSGGTEWMTTTGWRAATTAGLVRVVDLRNDAERGRQPHHPVVDASALSGIEVVHTPTEDPDDPQFLAECGPWLDHPRSWEPNAQRYPEKFARVFTAIAESPGPVLVHCAGGRDRTGMIVSMFLERRLATCRAPPSSETPSERLPLAGARHVSRAPFVRRRRPASGISPGRGCQP